MHAGQIAPTGRTHPTAQKIFGVVSIIVIVIAMIVWVKGCKQKSEAKERAIAAAKAYALAHPPPAAVRQVVQMPDRYTPCTFGIPRIRDLYTDGEPIWMLPVGWPESEKIYYSGKGHLKVTGGNIPGGEWKFWSANDPNKVVLIRIFAVR